MRIAIAGAGNVGRAIARELLDNGHQVLLIDKDPKALKLESVPDAEWLMADACEITSLDNAHLNNCQVLVAATGDDKANLVTSLLGKTEYGVPRVVARINHPKNEWLFDSSWGVDVAVSTPRIISALVEEAVSVGDVVRLFSFRKGQANLVELTLPDGSACIGKTVEEIELPENAAIAAIVRDGRVITAKAHDVFAAGDELLFVASADAEWLMADACEITSLDNAHLNNCQVLVAATGDDKANLVTSLLGKTEYGVPRVVARINHPKNEWLFDSSWGVDVAVSTPRIISALVEEAVSVGDVVRLFSFRKGQANLVELTLPDGSACIGKTVEEIELPENAAIAAIVRDGRVITAKAHDVFAAGDELLFVASADAEAHIKACFIS